MERKQNQMVSARDKRRLRRSTGLSDALDDLVSNRFVLGESTRRPSWSTATRPPPWPTTFRRRGRILADSGLVVAREDLGLEAAFWSQFPRRVFARRTRPAAITSRNFAALAPFHAYPGRKAPRQSLGTGCGDCCAPQPDHPFYFNFHVGDLGHTFICGPSGLGQDGRPELHAGAAGAVRRPAAVHRQGPGRRDLRSGLRRDLSGPAQRRAHGVRARSRRLEPSPANRAFLVPTGARPWSPDRTRPCRSPRKRRVIDEAVARA